MCDTSSGPARRNCDTPRSPRSQPTAAIPTLFYTDSATSGLSAVFATSRTPSGFAVTVAELIYLLCAATSLAAAWLLIRYYRDRRTPLLFWSALGFAGLALHNVLVYVDRSLLPDANISLLRS